MKDKFYAVVSDVGVVRLHHDHCEDLMAIFGSREDAEKMLLRNPESPLRVVEVMVVTSKS